MEEQGESNRKKMIILRQVYKYHEEQIVLRNLSCVFENRKIYGICGGHGSGKTLILQLIMGFTLANSGSISVNGQIVHKDIAYPDNVGYAIGDMQLLPYHSGFEALKQLGELYRGTSDEEVQRALKRVGLNPDEKIANYTPEMKGRLNLAQAIHGEKDIILLDEPMMNLSAEDYNLFRQIVREEKERGALVLITMEDKKELQKICDRVYSLEEGGLHEVRLRNDTKTAKNAV